VGRISKSAIRHLSSSLSRTAGYGFLSLKAVKRAALTTFTNVIARLDRATQYSRAFDDKIAKALEYRILRFRGV